MPATRQNNPRRPGEGAFTLIELLLVLALLAIVTALAAPRMISFFRGRALNEEGRRLLALTHYAQSRAVAEGVPVVLWLDPATGTYGQNIQPGFTAHDDRASTFSLESSLTLEVPTGDAPPVSELGDELLGLPEGRPVIRFTPDGYFDYASVPRFVLRQGTETALQIAPAANRLAYEILPYAPTQP
ncbi:GspH/FimT family protein [Opitutus sp. GAS368]|uniref:GspH/FimT family protein n=1 Tax=Opitutus sp. GAS368 TaxID=1882749 RepID=UPI00087D1564|nr:GspH/FimT family protein [Opitutus sp. GAS368]SDS36988.1 type II secretion system protein H [Opitutus sp. GAS368]